MGNRRLTVWITISLISVLAFLLLRALDREVARAEQAGFRMVVAQVESVLAVKTAELVAKDQRNNLKNFVNHNPMDWMNPPPMNYSGIVTEAGSGGASYHNMAAGHWYFDPQRHLLVYMPADTQGFVRIAGEVDSFIQFKVTLDFLDRNSSGAFEQNKDRILGLKLLRVAGRDTMK
ncbi:MAG: hypothetical protein H6999_02355 [Hahellaceae bacterium]|nr:hypothetical protein [Hahellaceae bacterium]